MATHRRDEATGALMRDSVDVVVIGAGVIGLAIARRLAAAGLSVVVTEQETTIGSATSARNSEVIHAGIYYRGTPLKARLCVAGRGSLYAYCASRNVAHRRIGKLIVAAAPEETPVLDGIMANARDAGVDDLVMLSGAEARALEPALTCNAALLSPSTGIIDAHGYMTALLADAEADGALLARQTAVTRISRVGSDHWGVHIAGEDAPAAVARRIVIAAGHGAQTLATTMEDMPAATIPRQYYARGAYFAYHGAHPFGRLIYPVPVAGGLGTHLTLDLQGRARFGPDVEWIENVDYAIDPARSPTFLAAARRIWPDLDSERLRPDYSGVRPKISAPGAPAADFAIIGPAEHGLSGVVALYGIESPGLTASLAIADVVAQALDIGEAEA